MRKANTKEIEFLYDNDFEPVFFKQGDGKHGPYGTAVRRGQWSIDGEAKGQVGIDIRSFATNEQGVEFRKGILLPPALIPSLIPILKQAAGLPQEAEEVH